MPGPAAGGPAPSKPPAANRPPWSATSSATRSAPSLSTRAGASADVVGLARTIYADRAFDRLPLLADALMDAGCADEQVLGHCREAGPHARGCWVVDMILDLT